MVGARSRCGFCRSAAVVYSSAVVTAPNDTAYTAAPGAPRRPSAAPLGRCAVVVCSRDHSRAVCALIPDTPQAECSTLCGSCQGRSRLGGCFANLDRSHTKCKKRNQRGCREVWATERQRRKKRHYQAWAAHAVPLARHTLSQEAKQPRKMPPSRPPVGGARLTG